MAGRFSVAWTAPWRLGSLLEWVMGSDTQQLAAINGNDLAGDPAGTPDEIAEVALFLASGHARWVTGQIIAVDGGQLLGV